MKPSDFSLRPRRAIIASLASVLLAACDKPAETPAEQSTTPSAGTSPSSGSTGSSQSTAASISTPTDDLLRARLPTPVARLQLRDEHAETIGADLIWCTPAAAIDDPAARDAAAAVLSHLGVLSDATEDTIIWGTLGPGDSFDPESPRGLLLDPAVWAGSYLSCFIFSSPATLERVHDSIVLKVPAVFRSGLPAADYPHPLWHSGDEWSSYARTRSIEFVLTDNRLLAAFRREAAPSASAPVPLAPNHWDGRWQWNEGAFIRPRTAHFAYVLSQDNPHTTALERAYADLVPVFTANNCLACHTPDNPAGARAILSLALPGQALAARATLAAVMFGESEGPPASTRCTVASLPSLPNAEFIVDAAARFLEDGDGATEYEWIRLIRRDQEAERISP